jgi:two-component system chemotaxis sensor kinase CheA
MSSQNRIAQLSNSLRAEITAARPGSHEGQLPILDLLGNLRDEAAGKPGWARLHTLCVGAWERVLAIVESGQAFQPEEVQWLNELPGRIQSLIQPGHASTAKPAQGKAAAPATATVVPPGEEEPINLKIGDDGDLLREFTTESREHLDHIEQGVLVLENQPADAERLNTIFRAFHTVKGGAGFLNLIPINRLAHVLESLLDLARQGKLAMAAPVMELILRGSEFEFKFWSAKPMEQRIGFSAERPAVRVPNATSE